MKADDIRRSFLEFFEERGHRVLPSSSLVPDNDPTLLFTNAGMVQFKSVFQGEEPAPGPRAVTSQKCVRAGGKHNDLEEVGRTARHHTFFEMLGNFSFGDYFKRDAIGFGWEFLTRELGLDPKRIYATVHHTDDEAAQLWEEVAGLDPRRIYRLGDRDNFWQMADTGPCGPCSELLYDLRPEAEWDEVLSTADFEAAAEAGTFIELWNLVFMQFDRDEAGTLHPLPAPSIDTGAGLERLASVLQSVDSNYHTDLFLPLLERVAAVIHRPYLPDQPEGVSYRVMADHARAVAFLIADGVVPDSDGRGYVLRRILRRAVRHAWLLGRREPSLVEVVDGVVERMGGAFPELVAERDRILATTLDEEQKFLRTISAGMEHIDAIAPPPTEPGLPTGSDVGDEPVEAREAANRVISGEDAFRLHDTYGFPIDLTELIAEERGWGVDLVGFEAALAAQRERSRGDRADRESERAGALEWNEADGASQVFVGYQETTVETELVGVADAGVGRLAVVLRDNPFYLEAGGQISDTGSVRGKGWSVDVDTVFAAGGRTAVAGPVRGEVPASVVGQPVAAEVDSQRRRDTERNHTGTHLLHAALREVLGDHVTQRGSLVAPDRLRFDFSHGEPVSGEQIAAIEERVNRAIWDDHPVTTNVVPFSEATARGAMALFGEKYGDEVRVVEVPSVSLELCGGTHVRHTGEIGGLRLLSERGLGSGVRRVEAVTGPALLRRLTELEGRLERVAATLKTPLDNVENRVRQIAEENRQLETLIAELRSGAGGGGETLVREERADLGLGRPSVVRSLRLKAKDAEDARMFGDAFRSDESGVAVVAAEYPDGRLGLFAFVSDDLVGRGIRADRIVREVAGRTGGSGGGKAHMAQGGVGDAASLGGALEAAPEIVQALGSS